MTGQIIFKDEPIFGLKPHAIAARGMVRTFQNVNLFDNMTVLDNVKVGSHKKGRIEIFGAAFRTPAFKQEEAFISEKSLAVLQLVGLEKRAAEMAGNLPFGQQRLLEIARALAGDPEILLLDEPAAGLNAHGDGRAGNAYFKTAAAGHNYCHHRARYGTGHGNIGKHYRA